MYRNKKVMISLPENVHEEMTAAAREKNMALSYFIRELYENWQSKQIIRSNKIFGKR